MKRFLPVLYGLGTGVVVTGIFLYQFIAGLSHPLSFLHNDTYLMTYILKHYIDIIQSGNWDQWTTFSMFHGFANSVFFGEFFPVHVLIGYPIYLLTKNIFFVSNALVIMTLYMSYVSQFLLCWYLTKRFWPSVIGGIIFAFNPFLMARFPDHMLLLNVSLLPFSLLCIEYILERHHRHAVGLLFLVCTFQLLTSSIYYTVFLTVILPLYAIVRIIQTGIPKKRVLLQPSALVGLIIFACTVSLVAWMYLSANTKEPVKRSLHEVSLFHIMATDWFYTAPNNLLYGSLKPLVAKRFPSFVREGVYSEHNLFPGFTVLLLSVFGLLVAWKKKQDRRLIAIGCIGTISFLLSFGPDVTLTDSLQFPGLYRVLYAFHPLFTLIRVPARFAVFVFLMLSVYSAFALAWAEDAWGKQRVRMLIVIVLLGVCLEYANKPLEFLPEHAGIKEAYASMNERSDIQVILEYPIANSIDYAYPQARMEELDAHYLAWSLLYHRKDLLNGYSGFIPQEYYKRANILSVNFPTNTKLEQLKSWGVDAIVIHADEFTQQGRYKDVIEALKGFGVPSIILTDQISVFDLTVWKASP